MSKSVTVQVRMEPGLKAEVESILATLGLSPSEAVGVFYHQIILNQGLPFEVKRPNAATGRAMTQARTAKGLKRAKNTDELKRQLGVSD